MKKNLLYICMALMATTVVSCSDDPMDATSKHVYTDDENVYLKTNTSATMSNTIAFSAGFIEAVTISLDDYEEEVEELLGMTVTEMLSGVSSGDIVYANIKASSGYWDKTEPTKGTTGWYYNSSGNVCEESSAVASVELDSSNRALIVDSPEDTEGGVSISVNVGFAIDNGSDYDDYIRFNFSITVEDDAIIMESFTIPEGDYEAYEVLFSDHEDAIALCLDMTVEEFSEAVYQFDDNGDYITDDDMALYMVDSDGNWITDASYTANGLGYWCESDGTPCTWGEDVCEYYVETWEGSVAIGRYVDIASGLENSTHFVYASRSDSSKYLEFILSFTYE